jgi:hypothetical protein
MRWSGSDTSTALSISSSSIILMARDAAAIVGLEERSRRPRRPAGRKIFAEPEAQILELRRTRQLGIKRLRNELLRDHGLRLSLDALH